MRFYFDIEDSEFDDEFGLNFCETVKNRACESLAEMIYNNALDTDNYYSEIGSQINELLKSKQNEIIESVVEHVAEKIAKKKTLMEFTPKVSELAAIDKDNVTYFEEMIDKAIAKRFSK